MQPLTGSVGLVGLVVARPAGAGGALVGIEVGADVAESPEHPASATSSVDNTATKSRFHDFSPPGLSETELDQLRRVRPLSRCVP
jgi:hypothetical protein